MWNLWSFLPFKAFGSLCLAKKFTMTSTKMLPNKTFWMREMFYIGICNTLVTSQLWLVRQTN